MEKIQLSVIANIEPVAPRQFIRLVVCSSQNRTLEEVIKQEATRKYIRDSVTILSETLGVEKKSIYNWGDDLDFERIPEHHKIALGYAKAANIHKNFAISILSELHETPFMTAGEFIEEVFCLSNLSKRQSLKVVSNANFRYKCKKILSTILRVSERTIDSWGADMYLEKMPEKYEVVLGYALIAAKSPAVAEFYNLPQNSISTT